MMLMVAQAAMSTFALEPGAYYLKTATGTYVEPKAAGSYNPGAQFGTDGALLRFTASGSAYTIQSDATGDYLLYSTDKNWDTRMATTATEANWGADWVVTEGSGDNAGSYCIARTYNGTTHYLGNGNTNAGTGVYSGETSPVYYTLQTEEEYRKEHPGRDHAEDHPQAVQDFLNRIGGPGASELITTRWDEQLYKNGRDRFVISQRDGKPYVEGSSLSAITAGIGWYLNHTAHVNLSWSHLTTTLSDLPLPEGTEEHLCNADYRYYLNYCTFGYSMTTWTWDRWQKEIDWMALHGINMPLQIVGLEEVWRRVLVNYNYTDDEAKSFAAGPAFTAWWGMNNLEGWGGTTDDAWFRRQADLGQKICQRQRELGMEPVLPGFAAIVPHDFATKNPGYSCESQGNWGGEFVRPYIMDPSGAKFPEVAAAYYKALEEVLGTSKYYSMDPFHEGGTIKSGKYTEGYRAIYDAMNTCCGADTKWVIQQWQWAGYQGYSLNAVPAGRLIVLDLFSDGKPAFDSYKGYAPQEAVFCAIPNFGGRSGFMGRLENMSSNYFTFKAKYNTIKGVGAAPEAIESVPVVYDLLYELPWMASKPNMQQWIEDYATLRYGQDNAQAKAAWKNILESAMAFGADAIQGPIEDVWAARPNLTATPASKWGKTIANAASIYTPERRQKLADAAFALLGESAALRADGGSVSASNYDYDLIEVGSQVMADYAYDLLLGIAAAKGKNSTLYKQRKQAFLDLILAMDAYKGTHQMFRLGNWTQTAREAAAEVQGATTATPDWYELDNARTLITTWGDKGPSEWGLRDYSYRSWQGLLKDYYYPRWEYYFNHSCAAPAAGWFYSEWNWAHELEGKWGALAKGKQMKAERTYYTREPEGSTVEQAERVLHKYLLPLTLKDGTRYYAYRALSTDLRGKYEVLATPGEEPIPAGIAAEEVSKLDITEAGVATLTLTDGTELRYNVSGLEAIGSATTTAPHHPTAHDLQGRPFAKGPQPTIKVSRGRKVLK